MTWWMLRAGVDVHDPAAVAARCGEPVIVSGTDPLAPTITVDGVDVAVAIRSDEVNAAVSPVSAVPEVRARLLELQRAVIAAESAERRHRRRGPRHRLGRRARRAGQALHQRRPGGPRRPPRRRGGRRRHRGHPGVAARPRQDRLRPRHGPAHDGRRRRRTSTPRRTRWTRSSTSSSRSSRTWGRTRDRPRVHLERPRSDQVQRAPRYLLHPLRPVARWLLRRRYDVQVHGSEQVPTSGPVIFASNHVGVIDGPLLAIFAPRPVHVLTKVEMFRGLARLVPVALRADPAGPVQPRPARGEDLPRGRCATAATVGIYPEGSRGAGDLERFHRGAAYLALVSGRARRTRHDARQPGARRHQRLAAPARARPSTWCSARPTGSTPRRGRAPGNKWRRLRCCFGSTCWSSWTGRARRPAGNSRVRCRQPT